LITVLWLNLGIGALLDIILLKRWNPLSVKNTNIWILLFHSVVGLLD